MTDKEVAIRMTDQKVVLAQIGTSNFCWGLN